MDNNKQQTSNGVKILFVLRSTSLIIYYKSIIEELCRRGHSVVALFDRKWSKKDRFDSSKILEDLKNVNPKFEYSLADSRQGFLRHVIVPLRELRNYRRYLVVEGQSDFYRRDWIRFLPKMIRSFLNKKNSIANLIIKSAPAGFFLRWVEDLSPADSNIRNHIKQIKPDAIVASPANMRHSSADTEYLKAANVIGVPSAVSVFSWDNLTVRGVIPVIPDILLVWNRIQMEEAITHHSIPASRIRIVGSPLFDGWFQNFKPSVSREEFCQMHKLRPNDPYIVYLGSSRNIAENEVWLIENLKKELAEENDGRKRVQIAVRPHPANYSIYEHLEDDGIIIVPKKGTLPATADARQLFYDTLHYSIGAASINTSAMIDAIIVDKPVVAVMADVYRQTQMEAVHFQYFLESNCLEIAKSAKEFSRIIRSLLDGVDEKKDERRGFVTTYIRPVGLNLPAGQKAADEIELLAAR